MNNEERLLSLFVIISLVLIGSYSLAAYASSQEIKQDTGQTAPLQQFKDSSGTVVWEVDVDGNISQMGNTGNLTTNNIDMAGNLTLTRTGFPTTYLQAGSLISTPNYIVYNYGSNIYVRDGHTGKIVNYGTNATKLIQYAIDQTPSTGGSVFVKNSGSVYSLVGELRIQNSHFKFLSDGAQLKLTSASSRVIHVGDGVGALEYVDLEISGFNVDANNLAQTGILLHGDQANVQWVTISRNFIGNATTNNLSIASARYTTIIGNHFIGGSTGLYFESVTRCTATGNTFSNQTNRAIHIDSSGVTIGNNVIGGGGKSGSSIGINIFNSERSQITNNFIKDVNIGISLGANTSPAIPRTGNIILGNQIWNAETAIRQQRYYDGTLIVANHVENVTTGISIATFGGAGNKNHLILGNTLLGDNTGSSVGITLTGGTGLSLGQNTFENFTTKLTTSSNPTFTTRWNNATFSGTGSQQDFTVTHRLAETPQFIFITPKTDNATGNFYVSSITSTQFTVHYKIAPVSGTKNVQFYWWGSINNN